jgi:hypothetical protein
MHKALDWFFLLNVHNCDLHDFVYSHVLPLVRTWKASTEVDVEGRSSC